MCMLLLLSMCQHQVRKATTLADSYKHNSRTGRISAVDLPRMNRKLAWKLVLYSTHLWEADTAWDELLVNLPTTSLATHRKT